MTLETSFRHLFIQQIFTEHLLVAKYYFSSGDAVRNQRGKDSALIFVAFVTVSSLGYQGAC